MLESIFYVNLHNEDKLKGSEILFPPFQYVDLALSGKKDIRLVSIIMYIYVCVALHV